MAMINLPNVVPFNAIRPGRSILHFFSIIVGKSILNTDNTVIDRRCCNAGGSSDISENMSLELLQGQGHHLLMSELEMVQGRWMVPPDWLTLNPNGLVTAVSVTRIRGAYDILDVTEDAVIGLINRKLHGLIRSAWSCIWNDPVQYGVLHVWVPTLDWANFVLDFNYKLVVDALDISTIQNIDIVPILAWPDHPAIAQ